METMREIFLSRAENFGYNVKYVEGNIVLESPEQFSYTMPDISIKDDEKFDEALERYESIIRDKDNGLMFFNLYKGFEENYDMSFYMSVLLKSLSNTDCQNYVGYINKFCNFLEDKTFTSLNDTHKLIGRGVGEFDVFAENTQEYYGGETPFFMSFILRKKGLFFKLPLVRYGIDNKTKTAYIYSIQRKKLYNNNNKTIKSVNQYINTVNSGVKEDRDVTPSMLCSLVLFLGMLKGKGIENVCADSFLTRRYLTAINIESVEKLDDVYHNVVNKFFKMFNRVEKQFEGLQITAYPQEQDSYLHMKISDKVESKNPLLNELFKVGENYEKVFNADNPEIIK
ncbi:MAG: hypothetical protein K2K31_00630 [Clostridia bacterium]|nr:hypothetical protein [Clostridia bacterium]